MARKAPVDKSNTINIKCVPVQAHIGALRFSNDDWKTIAFSFSRTDLAQKFADKELRYNSIYFLFGYEDGHEIVYVGQALKRKNGESVLARLREHDTSTEEKYRDKWNWVVAVTNEDDIWKSDELNALESIFIEEVPEEYSLNGRSQNSAGADNSLYADKVTQIKALITSIGFKIFENIPEKENIQVTSVVNDYSIVEDLQNGMARIPEIVTPDKVVKAMVDMLPAEVWNSHTVFLDPACKGGEYLREIYDRLMDTEVLQSEFPNAIERSNHILKNQIYGIALSQVSLERTAKKLLGEDRNIRVIPNYIEVLKSLTKISKETQEKNHIDMQSILNERFGRKMKFDVIIGNPPYQDSNGGGGRGNLATDIFDKFIINGVYMTSGCICLITPTKWVNKNNLKDVKTLLTDGHTEKLVTYTNSNACFPGADIAGGVSYFLYDKTKTYNECCITNNIKDDDNNRIRPLVLNGDVIIDNIAYGIVKALGEYKVFEPTSGDNPFGILSNEHGSIIENNSTDAILIKNDTEEYFPFDSLRQKELINLYKITIGIMNPDRGGVNNSSSWNVINVPKALSPRYVITKNFMILFASSDKMVASKFYRYSKTKLFRFLALQGMSGASMASKETWRFVPQQDFSSSSDIDWSQSISDIDKQLYKKYNLSDEEIAYIEKTIKPME